MIVRGGVTVSEKDRSLIVTRKVNFMVSLKSYRIQLSSDYKSKMNFQTGFSKCIVLANFIPYNYTYNDSIYIYIYIYIYTYKLYSCTYNL